MDDRLYQAVVERHIAGRPKPLKIEPQPDILLPERVVGDTDTDYANGSAQDERGSGTGSIREDKNPET